MEGRKGGGLTSGTGTGKCASAGTSCSCSQAGDQCSGMQSGSPGPRICCCDGRKAQMFRPLFKCAADPDYSAEATKFHEALTASKCDEGSCFAILCNKSREQIANVVACYDRLYGKNLVKTVKAATSGTSRKFMLCLVFNQCSTDAYWYRYSMKGLGTHDHLLIELATSQRYEELQCSKQAFFQNYGRNLGDKVKDDTSGDYCTFLLAILNSDRGLKLGVDYCSLENHVNVIAKNFEGQASAAGYIINVLSTCSDEHIAEVNRGVWAASSKSLIEVLRGCFCGSFLKAVTTCVEFSLDRLATFARKLKSAVDEDREVDVAVILTTRWQIDLCSILQEYDVIFGKSFAVDLMAKPDTAFWNAVRLFVSQ